MSSEADDDHELMRAIARGDPASFRRLVERHAEWSVAFVTRLISDRAHAEDLVQTAFIRVWEGASRWKPNAKFSTWFHRVLYNLCMDHFRAAPMAAEEIDDTVPDERLAGEEHYVSAEREQRVQNAIAALPPRQRAAIVLCYYQELSQTDAASMLGVSEGALESLLSRGRAALRRQIQSELH